MLCHHRNNSKCHNKSPPCDYRKRDAKAAQCHGPDNSISIAHQTTAANKKDCSVSTSPIKHQPHQK